MKKRASLFRMLLCLMFLFIVAQLSLFLIRYYVTGLFDFVISSSITFDLLRTVILIPILLYISLQLIAYFLLVAFIWFLAISTGELFCLSYAKTYALGLVLLFLASIAILSLNYFYFPHSFFAMLIESSGFKKYSYFILVITITPLLITLFFAYANVLKNKRHYFIASSFIVIVCCVTTFAIYDKYVTSAVAQIKDYSTPNIIIIGLDSLRPDFVNYLSGRSIKTPHLNTFLKNATIFKNAYTPLARTLPAWLSILTGKYPKHHHARIDMANPNTIVADETLASQLKKAGYETIYATDEPRFTDINEHYGFDKVIHPPSGMAEILLASLSDFPLSNLLIRFSFSRILFPYQYANRAADITYNPNNFLQLIRAGLARDFKKPVFLSIHLCLAHWPYTWATSASLDDVFLPKLYELSVERLDEQLGALFNILQSVGLLNHSLVVLLSDHGITLGMLGDRTIKKENYLSEKEKLKLIKISRLSTASTYSLDFKHDYSINTSYAMGTDVLSLKQYHILLAFRGFGTRVPKGKVGVTSSLIDVAPTILDFLHLTPLKTVDGMSLLPYVHTQKQTFLRSLFIETGDTLADMETDRVFVEKIIRQKINAYLINPTNGELYLNPAAEPNMIKNKQRAILLGDWLLAEYPEQAQFLPILDHSQLLKFKLKKVKPYFVLINLKSGKWVIGLNSKFSKSAPLAELMKRFKAFYGDEI